MHLHLHLLISFVENMVSYAYDINKTCFMKYVHKNQNHRALCYYAMNNHMYLVKDTV